MIISIFIIIIIILLIYNEYGLLYCSNKLFETFSPVNKFIYPTTEIKWQNFRNNYKLIKQEYDNFIENYHKPALMIDQEYTTSINIDRNKIWKTLFLRMYNKNTDYSKYFPETMKLINLTNCTTALFSIFDAGTQLSPHKGIDKGVLRYHIALKVPNNYKDCFIAIHDGEKYIKYNWQDGRDILFDDTYRHYAENNTNEQRIILLLDIKKEFNNKFLDIIHNCIIYIIGKNKIVNNSLTRINNILKEKIK